MMASLRFLLVLASFLLAGLCAPFSALAEMRSAEIGIVLMHGKGGSPAKHVAELAAALEGQGFLVANLEMPWSGRRQYDVDVRAAEAEVEAALSSLRAKGARKLFVAGHSQGGLFAFYCGGKHVLDGVIAIAPGGNVAHPIFLEKLGEALALAKKLIAEGRGGESARLADYEGAKGVYPITSTPAAYLSWFDPQGAMNLASALRNLKPGVPVLYIVPTNDYPGLSRIRQQVMDALPRHPRTRLYEPLASHVGAPSASIKEIAEWIAAVANTE